MTGKLVNLIISMTILVLTCDGQNSNKIQNGHTVRYPNLYPYIIYLQIHDPEGERRCGGTLVTDRHIVTAFHCLETLGNRYPITVYAGALDISIKVDPNRQSRFVLPTTTNMQRLGSDDVGLLEVDVPFELNQHVAVTKLQNELRIATDKTAQVMGWGMFKPNSFPKILRDATISYMNRQHDACKQVKNPSHACLSNVTYEQGACGGDSGSPVVNVISESSSEVAGIVVAGPFDCQTGYYAYVDAVYAYTICDPLRVLGIHVHT